MPAAVDKGIDHAHRVVSLYVVVEALGKKGCLAAIPALNKTPHPNASCGSAEA